MVLLINLDIVCLNPLIAVQSLREIIISRNDWTALFYKSATKKHLFLFRSHLRRAYNGTSISISMQMRAK